MTARFGAAAATAVAMTFALVVAGCGVQPEDTARPVERDTTPTPTSTVATPGDRTDSTIVWFVRNEALSRVLRTTSEPPQLAELVTALEAGPTSAEVARGVSTALAVNDLTVVDTVDAVEPPAPAAPVAPPASATASQPGAQVTAVEIATLQLSDELRARPADQQILAIGQTVLTVTSAGFAGVVFVGADGEPVGVPGPGGRIIEGIVTANDYASLRPRT